MYLGSINITIRAGVDFKDSWYFIKYCKHWLLALCNTWVVKSNDPSFEQMKYLLQWSNKQLYASDETNNVGYLDTPRKVETSLRVSNHSSIALMWLQSSPVKIQSLKYLEIAKSETVKLSISLSLIACQYISKVEFHRVMTSRTGGSL